MEQTRCPASREEFIHLLGDLRRQAGVEAADEAALVRLYDEVLQQVEQEKARLLPEYEQRCDRDGREPADRWLAGAAEALGERQGEMLRRLIQGIPALGPTRAG